jgi:hypothetical protein
MQMGERVFRDDFHIKILEQNVNTKLIYIYNNEKLYPDMSIYLLITVPAKDIL